MGVLSVSWTFSDRRSNIADVIQQGLQDTREHAHGSEVSRGRRVEVGRCGARGINFQYERYAAGRAASVQLSGILFEALSPRISDREVSAPGGGYVTNKLSVDVAVGRVARRRRKAREIERVRKREIESD